MATINVMARATTQFKQLDPILNLRCNFKRPTSDLKHDLGKKKILLKKIGMPLSLVRAIKFVISKTQDDADNTIVLDSLQILARQIDDFKKTWQIDGHFTTLESALKKIIERSCATIDLILPIIFEVLNKSNYSRVSEHLDLISAQLDQMSKVFLDELKSREKI